MSIFGIAILATLCVFAVGQGDPTLVINVEKANVVNKENPYADKWSATITPAKPENKLSMDTPMKVDIPENMMVRLNVKMGGKSIPPVEVTACKAIIDEVVGKGFVESGNPYPKACPIKKGAYKIVDYVVKKDKLPPVPTGKFTASVDIYMPGEEPFVILQFEGEISRNPALAG